MKPRPNKHYLTIQDIAAKYGKTRQAVFLKIKRTGIPHEKIGHLIVLKRQDLPKLGYKTSR